MSEQPPRPDPAGAGGEPAPAPVPDPAPAAAPQGRPVRLRRAPRYRAFVLTSLLAGVVLAAVLAATTAPSGGYSQASLFGYLGVALGLVGAVLGGLVAVLLERRR